ncbi:efflux RND transporter periplasmic adaptor subunit [Ideonella sp.]|uniref:efflux RND transporter periplasmic adaptor subunit n=1 Tax=Ideonella sp. TaxID=1929293 RepID=UPI002B476470|nr:efflux RND transporter periplasmic adaptor subunit [Ideonella sp.]HJV68187.1 efflux RND transporter periplasmic adaptor subunit [Ideonella sp.]
MGIQENSSARIRPAVLGRGVAWLLAASTAFGAMAAAPINVPTVAVGPAATGGSVEFDATLQAVRQATVAAQSGGNVLALLVKAGDSVRAGQVLARLDDRDTAAGLARSDAGVTQAEAEARNARLAAERSRELRTQGFISQAALDSAETQARAAQAGLQQAQGARRQAALAHGFTTVTAPFDGIVLATHLEAGDLASPGRPILTLYAPGALRAVVQVPASRAGVLRGAKATPQVELPAAGEQAARWVAPLRSTELPGADPVAQTVEWRLDLPADAAGRPGQSVRVRATGAAPTAAAAAGGPLTVPAGALLRRGELTAVYVAREGGFTLRAVRAGTPTADGRVAVLAGLKPGEAVAADAERAGLAGAVPAR